MKRQFSRKWDNPDRLCEACGRKASRHTFEEKNNCYNSLVNSIDK